MKFLLSFFYSFLLMIPAIGQDVNAIIKEADRLEAVPNEMAAFNKFKDALVLQPNNVYVLSKCSELCSRIGSRETNTKNRDVYFTVAVSYANKALALAPENDRANVSMAMALGKTSLTKSGKEKIKSAKEIKRLVDVALKSNPNNYVAWHILGRWNYEIANVGSIERAAAKVFMGGIPTGSIANAIMYFEKARTLSPQFILNHLELAKAYHKNDENAKAIALLKGLQAFPNSTEDDGKIKAEAMKLVKEWE